MPPLIEEDVDDIETTNYLLNNGYLKANRPRKIMNRHKVYNCNDQVNTMKAVDGSSSESSIDDNYARSKMGRELLESFEDKDLPELERKKK